MIGSSLIGWRNRTQPEGTPAALDLVGDITQIDSWEGPTFLATVIDFYNGEFVGWSMVEHHRAEAE